MQPERKYFKIGVFVLGACTIFAAGIVLLGLGAFLTKHTLVETYIDETIQGLDPGAPVKYRGVKVGKLEETDFVAPHYKTKDARIRLIMAFSKEAGHWAGEGTPAERIRRLVDMGMRVRLASEGLLGGVYLELDLLNPDENPPAKISWEPEYPYLPSVPSAQARMTQRLDAILEQMGTIRFDEISRKMVTLLGDVDTVVKKLDPVVSEVRLMVRDTHHQILEHLGKELGALVAAMKEILEKEVAPTLQSARAAAGRLPETLEKVEGTLKEMTATLRRVDRTLASEAGPTGETLDNLRVVSGDLRQLMDEMKKYPAQALFGEAPPRKREAK